MPLIIHKRKGSPFWYLRGTVRGEPVEESTKTADRDQAEAIRAKREWEIVNRQLTGAKTTATFLEAAVGYMEGGGERRFLAPLLNHFGSKKLSDIGQTEVEAAAKSIYPGLSPSSINRMVFTPVSAVISWAAKRKLADRPAFERPQQPRGRVRWITYDEAERLITACSPHMKPLVTFLLFTGARVGEALALDWHEVDLKRTHATFLETKNGERRGIPLHSRIVAELSKTPEHRRIGAVFRTHKKEPYEAKEDGGGQIKTAFKGACRRAGITDFHPHDCRHTWATWHYAANRDLTKLMRLGGWKSVTMVMRYAHTNVDDLLPSIEMLGAQNTETDSSPVDNNGGKQGDSE